MKATLWLLALLLSISGLHNSAIAQTAEPGAPAPSINASGINANSISRPAGDSELLLRTSTGELIPVSPLLGKNVVEELLLRAQEQLNEPRFTIAQMEITATVDRDEVRLTVELQIRVSVESEWVIVPLAFGDVYVTAFSSTSDAPESESLLASGEQNVRQWHLKGKGLHTVRMELIGKARKISPGVSQLNLSLPAATASHATFAFASPVELQKLPAGSVEEATRDDQGVRSVEFWGLTSGFSLTWSEVVARVAQKPVIQVQNRMKLDLTTIPVTLTGTQVLQISGSPVSELQVTFPEGFLLLEADARNAAGVSVLNNFESPPTEGRVTALIRLTSALEGALTLSYDLELANRQFPQDIRVSIPSIQNANQQPGDLDILFPAGLLVQQTELKGAQRIRVTSESELSVASTAFRMRSPESLIVLHVEETEAQFAVYPELALQPDPQSVIMAVKYPVSVLKGSLLELSIQWPGYSSAEWQILPSTMRLNSGKTSLPLSMQPSETDPDLLQMTFPERQSGEFTVEFRAFAALAAVRSGAVQLRCPEVQSRSGQPFVITTIESDDYSIRPISMGNGELLPTVPVPATSGVADAGPARKSESWLHDDPSIPIRLELPAQAPSVTAEITLGMYPRENGIEVQESIRFEIEHRDMSTLSLQVPEGIRPTVRVAGQTESLRATIESSNWSFRLPQARRGVLNVDVTYLWTTPMEAAQSIDHVYQLPIILPRSADVRSVQAGTSSLSGLRVSDESKWSPVYSERFESAMETTQPVVTVPLKWQERLAVTSSASPDLVFVQTRILGAQSMTSTLAVYESVPEFIAIETPADLKVEAILLGGESLMSADADKSVMEPQRIADRNVIRRTISARKVSGAQNGPVILEFRVREKLPEAKALWLTSYFRRATIVGESSAVPVVWCVGSQDEFQVVSASSAFSSLTQRGATVLPGGDTARTLADRQLRAVLSPYKMEVQSLVSERAEEWLDQEGRQDLFFGTADSGALKLHLVHHVSLLLISAMTCVAFFVLMAIFRQITMIVPILFMTCLGLLAWLIFPERTLMLTPYVVMGIVFGMVSIMFQRFTTDRRVPFAGTTRTTEFPTVFGFSGVLSPPFAENGDSVPSQPSRSQDSAVPSTR
jgi:hypothetical protein